MIGCIYKVTNEINNKVYIGKTMNFVKRKSAHLRCSRNDSHFVFHKALRKYGEDNFKWEIILKDKESNLSDKEKDIIAEYNCHYLNGNGYNMTLGGDGMVGLKHSDEFKRNMSKKMMGNKYTLGNKLSDEHKLKVSIALKGVSRPQCGWVHSKEQKEHLSEVMMGRVFSETHKANLAKVNRASHNKNIYKFRNTNNEEFAGTMLDFKEKYNLDRSSITRLVNGKSNIMKGWTLIKNN